MLVNAYLTLKSYRGNKKKVMWHNKTTWLDEKKKHLQFLCGNKDNEN